MTDDEERRRLLDGIFATLAGRGVVLLDAEGLRRYFEGLTFGELRLRATWAQTATRPGDEGPRWNSLTRGRRMAAK